MNRPLIYNAFAHVTPNHHSHGLWRTDDGAVQRSFATLAPWISLAQEAEAAGIDALFLADVAGVYDTFRGGPETSIRTAMQFPSHDPAALVSALGAATSRIGFVITASPMQEPPFSFARKMSTLDHLTGGRVGWNIVTSYLDNAARNYGLDRLPEHDSRYAWAEEYIEILYKLWEASWEDDALIVDPVRGIWADPARVHRINHHSARYSVEGPHLVQPSPQRTPLLAQAGGSEAGRAFAARHAEMIFAASRSPETAAADVADLRARAVAAGREAQDLRVLVMLAPILGSTEEEARRRQREFREALSVEALQSFWSGNLGVDIAGIDPSDTISHLRDTNHVRGSVRAFIEAAPDGAVTFADVLRQTISGQIAGTPEQIADHVARYAQAGVDGFNVVPVTTLGWWGEFRDHLAPVLRARGLMANPDDAPGDQTLRQRLLHQGDRLPARHPGRQVRLSPAPVRAPRVAGT